MKKEKVKKIISWTIDGILVAIIGLLLYVQISMVVTKKPENHNVPMAFGHAFLYVVTDSMDDPENPNCIGPGCGIIIEKVGNPSSLNVSNPIMDGDKIVDYDKTGDVVTFYWEGIKNLDTHRLISKRLNEETGKWEFQTLGDNPKAHTGVLRPEKWTEDDLVGKVVFHSMGFGSFLSIASPDAAAMAGKTAWFLPVAVLVPLLALAGMSVWDVYKKARQQEKEDEKRMLELMVAAGIDPNDEEAAELFRRKQEIKDEIRARMDAELERARKEARKRAERERKGKGK